MDFINTTTSCQVSIYKGNVHLTLPNLYSYLVFLGNVVLIIGWAAPSPGAVPAMSGNAIALLGTLNCLLDSRRRFSQNFNDFLRFGAILMRNQLQLPPIF